ncbi:DUF6786 family protein [Paenibacillus spongiae]|uniref:DUF4432 family protein n=1 Tax=Paenibacillus spongiae TaxID=2909671 RepID=A0ABY5S3S3_9BACL|nr:DUF6786 family protein [Paenibacillus spongiae]UVI27507.1 hypothetical protein L1F29_18745 [Paenibacillus spongiae]
MNRNDLSEICERLGWKYAELTTAEGGAIMVLERGCRVIGVYPYAAAENAVWVRPELARLGSFADVATMTHNWNIGGDRTLVSPEVEYFYDPEKAVFLIPEALDPGRYKADIIMPGEIEAKQSVVIPAYRSHYDTAFEMTKRIRLAPDPLKRDGVDSQLHYTFVGYEVEAEIIRTVDENMKIASVKHPPISLWNLMQVPADGEAILPTYGTAEATPFFEDQDQTGVLVHENRITCQIDARCKRKISIRAGDTTGRIGYMRTAADRNCYLLIRNFHADPAKHYGDVPLHRQEEWGHCVQCYNDDGALGYFGEIEYHTPLMESSEQALADVSQVWCYAGDEEQIRKIADLLLLPPRK